MHRRPIVRWSPHSSRHFVVGAQDLRLFEVVNHNFPSKPTPSPPTPGADAAPEPEASHSTQPVGNSDRAALDASLARADVADSGVAAAARPATHGTLRQRTFRIVNSLSEVPQIKCLDWSADPSRPMLVAAGLASGKLLLTSFDPVNPGVLKECVPRHSRPCNDVHWNPVERTQVCTLVDYPICGGAPLHLPVFTPGAVVADVRHRLRWGWRKYERTSAR